MAEVPILYRQTHSQRWQSFQIPCHRARNLIGLLNLIDLVAQILFQLKGAEPKGQAWRK